MTSLYPRSTARTSSGRRATRMKKYVVSVICVVVIIGAVVAAAMIWGPLRSSSHPTGPVRYLGVYEPDAPGSYTGVNQFAKAIGRQPSLVSYYSPWLDRFQAGFAATAARHGAIALVQMDPKTAQGESVPLAGIAAGRYDSYLRSYAAGVKASGTQVILSFGHEMNGNWYSWGHEHTSAGVFVKAWRHIVNVFRAAGAKNVTWLWTVNVINESPPIPNPRPWWPGNSYVNWVGIDGYYFLSSQSFAQVFGPTIVDVRALTHDPIFISETGASPEAGQAAKITDLFDGIRTYGLLGFLWFDENTKGRAWRLSSPGAFAAFRQDAKTFMRPPATSASAPSGTPSP